MKNLNYKDYDLYDFVGDEFFVRWVKNPSQESSDFWENWIKNNSDKRKEVLLAKSLIESFSLGIENDLGQDESHKLLDSILTKSKKKEDERVKKSNSHGWKVAASIVLPIIVFSLFWLSEFNNPDNESVEPISEAISKSNPKGQRSTIFLDDGSRVILSYGSRIKYQKPFGPKNREVFLEGEAFFEIAHNEEKPFIVRTDELIAEVLGTSFNVNARKNQQDVAVSLVTGKVRVSQSSSENSQITISPGEQILFDKRNKKFIVQEFSNDEISWKDGVIIFNKSNKEEVLSMLENWYGVNISEENNSQVAWNITARFEDQTLESILKSIGFVMNFHFEIERKEIRIRYEDLTQ